VEKGSHALDLIQGLYKTGRAYGSRQGLRVAPGGSQGPSWKGAPRLSFGMRETVKQGALSRED
jgi:hypothetical protein